MRFRITTFLFLMAGLILPFSLVAAGQPFEVEIKLSKDIYALGEPLEGEIIVENTYPATIPVTFLMEMHHEGKLKYSSRVNSPLLTGKQEFSFKTFAIPPAIEDSNLTGSWSIIIKQAGQEESARIEFTVLEN